VICVKNINNKKLIKHTGVVLLGENEKVSNKT
jgi:hypothetical protein